MQSILLNPGPVTLSQRVRDALPGPDICHREAEFFALQDEVRERLLAVYGLAPADWSAVLLTGSGTAAMEAMIASLVPDEGRLLVLENGVYGERLSQIAAVYHIDYQALNWAWGETIDLDRVAATLRDGQFSHLALVHHETTTGRLNDLAALAALCEKYAVRLLVDGISSFGAEAIDFANPQLDAVAVAANKCLHGIPGLAMVITRRSALQRAAVRSLYLDLAAYARLQDQQSTPFTPAVPSYFGLREALREFEQQGGWQSRRTQYRKRQERVRRCLESLGVEPLLPAAESSCVLRSYYLPAQLDYAVLHRRMKWAGFVIYAGQGGLAEKMFRISTMGEISSREMDNLLDALSVAISGAE